VVEKIRGDLVLSDESVGISLLRRFNMGVVDDCFKVHFVAA
jgi:hypothetical protein